MKRTRRATLVVLGAACITLALVASAATRGAHSAAAATPDCTLANGVKHVIYLQFDNTHYKRDNPNVASDLEQMPHLLDFLKSNGTLFTNDHTILISHTAGGILSSLTGLYPDRQGQTVSNSYDFYQPNGVPSFRGSSFQYWTSPVNAALGDTSYNMITDGGKNTPAPWGVYTQAGCDVGGTGTANIELENNSTDVSQVYGPGSPQDTESPAQKTTDFVGIAIHCAQTSSSVCANNTNARDDLLPDQPGGYTGYKALFGAKYVNPAIANGSACVNDTSGDPINGAGATGCGFPGFDGMLAKRSLGYVAQMQEAGVPVTYAYISDAHDNHTLFRASGPGEADYKQQLADYDSAFQSFFTNLASHGIDKSNTLFVVTVDEGDHFAGAQVTPDSSGTATYSHTACPQASLTSVTTCPSNQIGEVNAKIGGLLPAGEPAFDIHFDDAPTFYVNGDAAHPNGPARTDPAVRKLEQDVAAATAPDPYAGSVVPISQFLADPVEEKTLHMINNDPQRTPTFTMFGNPDFFFQTSNLSGGCAGSTVCVNPGFAWNHGDVQPEIGNTWVGMVGPGVSTKGVDSKTWTDHTNLKPTIDALLGLKEGYTLDGRVLVEGLTTKATPKSLVAHDATVNRLDAIYEQVNAPFGQFALDTLKASTKAVGGSDATAYDTTETKLADLTSQRDALVAKIRTALNAAAFDGTALDEQTAKGWIDQAQGLLDQASSLASA